MEMNWRVVITVANSSAPKVLMVWLRAVWAGAKERGGQARGAGVHAQTAARSPKG